MATKKYYEIDYYSKYCDLKIYTVDEDNTKLVNKLNNVSGVKTVTSIKYQIDVYVARLFIKEKVFEKISSITAEFFRHRLG